MSANSPQQFVSILQITDSHLFADRQGKLLGLNTDDSLQSVIEKISQDSNTYDLVLATGDISQDGSLASYLRFKSLVDRLNKPTYWLEGNHDELAPIQSALKNSTHVSPCVIERGRWLIVMLNSSVVGEVPGYLAAEELAFLQQKLAKFRDKHILIALHHHVLATGCEWLDEQIVGNRDEFLALIDQYPNVRGVIWGHVHQEMDIKRNRVRMMSTPSTCVQFKPNSKDFSVDDLAPGYRWLRCFDNGEIETGVSRVNGVKFEIDYSVKGY